jgi:hypothetical protein
VGAHQQISFTGTGESLVLGDVSGFSGAIGNFKTGETIELSGVSPTRITGEHFSKDILTLSEAGGPIKITFASSSNFQNEKFSYFADDDSVGITLTKSAAMNILGPQIATGGSSLWAPTPDHSVFATPVSADLLSTVRPIVSSAPEGWLVGRLIESPTPSFIPSMTL